jgi:curved DNA-binding protein CbpA
VNAPARPDPKAVLAQLAAFGRAVAPTIDDKSYYELLNLRPGAALGDVRAAYYRIAAQLHPDRYFALDDAVAKRDLEAIYARITEAYRVLSAPDKRAAYDKALAQGQKRLATGDRERKGPRSPEEGITHAEARKFFRLGMLALEKKDWKGAVLNFNFARGFDPKASIIGEKLAEAQAHAKAAPPGTGGSPGR